MGGAAAPVRSPVPVQAVIPWGFAGESEAGLARALVDAARFGFTQILLLVPARLRDLAAAAVPSAGVLPHQAHVTLRASAAIRAGGALAESRDELDPAFLLLDPALVVEANWLDLLPAFAEADHAVVLAENPVAPADGSGGPQPAGLALVRRDALGALPADADMPALLRHLAPAGGAGLLPLPQGALHPAGPETPARPLRPALFLDRDGTLNEDYGYVSDPDRLVLLPGAAAAVKRANELGWSVFLVTNQSGVGRGFYPEAQVLLCNAALQDQLRAQGAHLDDMRYAADHPEAQEERYRQTTGWRKPEPGMLVDLMAHWPVRCDRSLMVGDKDSDIAAGRAAGLAANLLFPGGDLDAFLAPHLRDDGPR